MFPRVREAVILLTALPFELNAKANLFCTVSQNIHVVFAGKSFVSKKQKDPLCFSVILNAGPRCFVMIGGEEVEVEVGSVMLLDSKKNEYLMNFVG